MKTKYYTVNGKIIGERAVGGNRRNYVVDALGSVTGTSANGALENTYLYSPYGALLSRSGSGTDPGFGWVGTRGYRKSDALWADVYVRARFFSTAIGRWITEDPLTTSNQITTPPYGYGSANPVTFIDPSGLFVNDYHAFVDLEKMAYLWTYHPKTGGDVNWHGDKPKGIGFNPTDPQRCASMGCRGSYDWRGRAELQVIFNHVNLPDFGAECKYYKYAIVSGDKECKEAITGNVDMKAIIGFGGDLLELAADSAGPEWALAVKVFNAMVQYIADAGGGDDSIEGTNVRCLKKATWVQNPNDYHTNFKLTQTNSMFARCAQCCQKNWCPHTCGGKEMFDPNWLYSPGAF